MRTRKPVPVHNLKVSRRGKVKKRTILWRLRRAFYLGGLAVTVGAAGLIFVLGKVDLPVDPSEAPDQQQTSFICAADIQVNCNAQNAMAQFHGSEDRELVSYKQIPPILREAVIATEDKDFFKHGGVDPMGIARAAVSDIRGSGVRQGGSTITQQYVKQTYLSSEQTFTRKIKEAVMAVKLEQQIGKKTILKRYLNTVYFGRGAYGVQAASRVWFGHDVEAVNIGEAAFLAGLLRNPNGADPYRGAAKIKEATRRREVSLNRMEIEGYITAKEHKEYGAVPLDPTVAYTPVGGVPEGSGVKPFIKTPPKISTLGEKVKGAEWGSEYFVEHVRQWLVKKYTSDVVYGGGLKVYTTLDLNMQKDAYDAVTSTLDRPSDPSAALVAIDDQGQVKAMMGGTDFTNNKVNLATGKSGGGLGRQPGSTFKMFALAEAVREGYSIQSIVPSPPKIEIPDQVCARGGRPWNVRGGPGGGSSLVSATKNSINTVYAQLMLKLGPAKVLQMARDMGVTASGLQPYCANVLGGGEVSVLDMAAGYSTLANDGIAKSPVVVTRVEFPDGRVERFTPNGKQVLTPDQADRVTYCLQQVIQGGTGTDAALERPAAGKTGTTQNNADGWFVGYTPKLTAAVWMGYPKGLIPMEDVHGIKVQGGTFPARMWKKFMDAALADQDTGDFPQLDPEALGAGNLIDPNLGRTTAIAGGEGHGGGTTTGTGGATTGTTQPRTQTSTSTPSSTTRPQSTVTTTRPVTTTSRPTTTQPQTTTTKPKGTGTGATGTGGAGATGPPG